MSKMIITMSLAALIWVMPVQTRASFHPESTPGLRAYLEQTSLAGEVIPASARFSVIIGPRRNFAFGHFGRQGFHRFGKRGFFPNKYGRFPSYRYPYTYGYYPDILGRDRFFADRFFWDGYGRSGPPNSYYSPFGTRRPGW